MTERFDRWVERGPFTPADLGIYRIVFAVSALLIAPNIAWLAQYPDFMYHAPPGPLRLLSGFPSLPVLIVLEVLRSTALVLLGLGLWTRYVSIAAAIMLAITYGLTYCLGKVDHSILLVLAPLVLAFANWGDRFSIDALRDRSGLPQQPQRQWPLRLLALLIGWGFFIAALTKLITGWLSFSSQSARGYFVLGFLTEGRTYWLADWVAAHDVRAVWELVDWLTVAFEFAILLTFPWWRSFRIALAVAATFHLGVLLVMDIDFSHTVVPYGAFVSWGVIARRMGDFKVGQFITSFFRKRRALFAGGYVLPGLLAVAVGGAAWMFMVNAAGKTAKGPFFSDLIVFVAAVVGLWYLALQARAILRASGQSSDASESPESAEPELQPRGRA
jgi:hypothetical protein